MIIVNKYYSTVHSKSYYYLSKLIYCRCWSISNTFKNAYLQFRMFQVPCPATPVHHLLFIHFFGYIWPVENVSETLSPIGQRFNGVPACQWVTWQYMGIIIDTTPSILVAVTWEYQIWIQGKILVRIVGFIKNFE